MYMQAQSSFNYGIPCLCGVLVLCIVEYQQQAINYHRFFLISTSLFGKRSSSSSSAVLWVSPKRLKYFEIISNQIVEGSKQICGQGVMSHIQSLTNGVRAITISYLGCFTHVTKGREK